MAGTAGLVTNPIALCAYALSLVFGLLAKMWNSKGSQSFSRPLFRLAVFVSVTALLGGLALAWYQTPHAPASMEPAQKSAAAPAPAPQLTQSSSGANTANVQNSGSGSVTVQIGNSPNPQDKPVEKKK